VLVYRCLHGQARSYSNVAEGLLRVADVDSRRRLRSASTSALIVPTTRLVVGDRALYVAAARGRKSPCNSSYYVASPAGQTNQRGLGLSGSIHEEAHVGLYEFAQFIFEGVEAGSFKYSICWYSVLHLLTTL